MRRVRTAVFPLLLLAGCSGAGNAIQASGGNAAAAVQAPAQAAAGEPFQVEEVADLDEPWAMAFLPGSDRALITEKRGRLLMWREGAEPMAVAGTPQVAYGGQGGLGDVALHPRFAENNLVYLSWIEAGEGGTFGAVVGRGRLVQDGAAPRLDAMQIIWRQTPKLAGRGHFGHRIAFGPDTMLYVSSGDRQAFDPAQDLTANLGKILRLNDDGTVPTDNPFAAQGGVAAQLWTLGHRNPLGLAFALDGRLWSSEMGPAGGDEMNLIERGANYGYPIVSNGDHYDGRTIPDHDTRPDLNAPEVTWTPVISPSSMIFYTGARFPAWRGSALIGGLSSQGLVRVAIDGNQAREVERFAMGARIREVEQGPDGVYVLEDERNGSRGRLLRLVPTR